MAVKTTPIAGRSARKSTRPRISRALPRVLFIVGQTSSGKTDLGIRLARIFNGEIVNADARQIYQDLDIGTGKPPGKRSVYHGHKTYLSQGIPHYLMDFLSPNEVYSAPEWKHAAVHAVSGISGRGHLPIVVGGTGLYITSLVDNFEFPEVAAKPELRAAFESKNLAELAALLESLDPKAKNVVDLKNKRRIIRAIEVITFTGKPFSELRVQGEPLVRPLLIGIRREQSVIYQRIEAQIEDMLDRGLVEEVRQLLKAGVPENAPGMSAIGYRDFAAYLRGEATLEEVITRFKKKTKMYARRQWTWFKRDPRIHWVESDEEASELVQRWLKSP